MGRLPPHRRHVHNVLDNALTLSKSNTGTFLLASLKRLDENPTLKENFEEKRLRVTEAETNLHSASAEMESALPKCN